MEGAKKKEHDDSVNVKIQRKFDLVFGPTPADLQSAAADDHTSDLFFDEDSSMSESAKKESSSPKIDLNFDSDDGIDFSATSDALPVESAKKENTGRLAIVPDENDGLEFNLDFGEDSAQIPELPQAPSLSASSKDVTKSDSHFELDLIGGDDEQEIETRPTTAAAAIPAANTASHDNLGLEMDALFDAEIESAASQVENVKSGTQPTIVYDKNALDIPTDDFNLDETTASTNSSADLMTTEEAKANIESTIKDILRPKPMAASTQEIDLSSLNQESTSDSVPVMDFKVSTGESTGKFDLSSMEFADKEDGTPLAAADVAEIRVEPKAVSPVFSEAAPAEEMSYGRAHTSFVSDEDSSRFQATIRQMREERESLLNEIKMLKGESRELEQDNLTLKAALDEAKIEVSILRKRHMVELEDMKYRLALNEEKRALAEEKAKSAEARKEKLEQRVRIDFNQVKQREKELETKLEMLSIDVDSQVQSRDQKILELRRKIDSLEFNMENASIREQKSQDDKRKLEDKLNKIMKTLRHSIKNLEDDIDQVTDEDRDDKNDDGQKSKA